MIDLRPKELDFMNNLFLALFCVNICFFSMWGQDSLKTDSVVISKWKLKAVYTLNGTQTSFINWNAGGRNNISLLGTITSNAYYEFKKMKWNSDLSMALGGLRYIDQGIHERMQKTDDRFDLSSNLGFKVTKYIYLTMMGGLKTQMLDGFNFPNDSIRVSSFLAPGYVSGAIGMDYIRSDHFSVFTSPFAMKLTIVNCC
jgi:hypothetical protein